MRRSENKWIPAVLAASLAAAALSFLPSSVPAIHGGSNREIVIGDDMPPETLTLADGSTMDVPGSDGITVLLFWATWSPRSAQALELWQRFRGQYADHPLTVLSVNSDHQDMTADDTRAVLAYLQERNLDLPVTIDRNLRLFNQYGVKALPTVFLLDSHGIILYRYASFPSSAELDLKEELEVRLGIRERETEEEKALRGKLEYQPRNNALLYYRLGVQLHRKGFPEKAKGRYIVSLQRDSDYEAPLRALEGIYYREGNTTEAQEKLRDLLVKNDLEDLVSRLGEGEPIFPVEEVAPDQQITVPGAKEQEAEETAAPASTAPGVLTPMERMKLLLEKQGK